MKIFFRDLIEQIADYAIVVLDSKGTIRSWNAGARAITGYTDLEAVGRPLSTFLRETLVSEAISKGRASRQCWLLRKNGKPLWTENIVQTVAAAKGGQTTLCWLCRDPFDM
ncbi:MAG TPA: PAS domain-containing protein [Steroidobacteraceae bacterium]|nr:PAS domain-containing protein [Steroidobacteraceae bacterium]